MPESLRQRHGAVHAVVAVFHPDHDVVDNLRQVAGQVDRVVVVDDGSGPAAASLLTRIEHELGSEVSVLRLGTNRGIAHALNTGIATALKAGASTVITLDQDSRIGRDYLVEAADAARRVRESGCPLFIIAAGVQSGRPVRPVSYADRGDAVTPTLEAIQSGLVISAEVLERVGLLDEGLFIDCVDTDFIVRAAELDVPTYLARRCSIDHPLGRQIETPRMRTTRSGRRSFAYHPAWRRYYISRNRAVVFARHGMRRPAWAVAGLMTEAAQLLRCLAFGPDKGRQTAAVALGVLHAALGRRGRLGGRGAALLSAPR